MAKSSRNVGKEFLKVLNVMSGSTEAVQKDFLKNLYCFKQRNKLDVRVVIRKK